MKRKYDKTIQQHYQKVAEDCGLSATSTMADEITRKYETEAILQFVSASHCGPEYYSVVSPLQL